MFNKRVKYFQVAQGVWGIEDHFCKYIYDSQPEGPGQRVGFG